MSNSNQQGLEARLSSVNAGFTFFADCVVNLFIVGGILLGVYGLPPEIVLGRIIPGCACAIFVGNLLLSFHAWQLRRKTNQPDLTAIPIGLDIATTFLMCFVVIGPVFQINKAELGDMAAGNLAWRTGVAIIFLMGILKLVLSFIGNWVQKILPDSAVLGSLSGVAIVWLGAEAMLGVFEHVEVGLVSLAIMIYALMAGHRLPGAAPGALAAFVVGTLVFVVIAALNLHPSYELKEIPSLSIASIDLSHGVLPEGWALGTPYIGVILPLGLLASISAVNIVRSAKVDGDDYRSRRIMQLDAVATIVGALSGGVVQTIAYLGHSTYKRMGGGISYSLMTGTTVLVLGLVGAIGAASTILPNAVLKAVLLVVAADILRVSLTAVKPAQGPSYLFAIIPAIFSIIYTKLDQLLMQFQSAMTALGAEINDYLTTDFMASFEILAALSRGYILTSLLWGSMVAWVISRQFKAAALAALCCGLFSIFGIIHSVDPQSRPYFPWDTPTSLPWRFMIAYGLCAILFLAMPYYSQNKPNDVSST